MCSGSGLVSASDIWSNQLFATCSRRRSRSSSKCSRACDDANSYSWRPLHPAGQVLGKQLELHVALGDDLVCDLLAALVTRGLRFFGELLQPGALFCEHLLELFCDLAVRAAEVVAVELGLAALAQARHQVAKSLHPFAGLAEAGVEHAAQRRVGVAVVEQVVGDLVEEAVDLVGDPVLGPVPARVRPAAFKHCGLALHRVTSGARYAAL